jgi:ATP-dependent helicase/nuclease subunit B
MIPFTDRVAAAIIEQGIPLHQLTVIVPSERMITYMQRALFSVDDQPKLSPKIVTIDRWMQQLVDEPVADRTRLLFQLYTIFRNDPIEHETDTFDAFLNWGQLLLNDFDEIDRYLVQPKQLFKNLRDIRELENWSFNQEELSLGQLKFMAFWEKLGPYYFALAEKLVSDKQTTKGKVYRDVAENIDRVFRKNTNAQFVFAGFNALSIAELSIMKQLFVMGRAHIFIDSDNFYLNDSLHEAGAFQRVLLEHIQVKTLPFVINELQHKSCAVEIVECAQTTGQAKVVGTLLAELTPEQLNETLVLLGDEQLIVSLIQHLPVSIGKANITLGLPLRATSLRLWVDLLFRIQEQYQRRKGKSIYYKDVIQYFHHPFVQGILTKEELNAIGKLESMIVANNRLFLSVEELGLSDRLKLLNSAVFEPWKNNWSDAMELVHRLNTWLDELLPEKNLLEKAVLRSFDHALIGLTNVMNEADVPEMQLGTFKNLFNQHWSGESMSYFGNPMEGLQIMGLLETRGLDFKRLIVMGLNEGTMPPTNPIQTLIPMDLRRFFQLPTPREKQGLFAHHFYRLLHCAEEIHITYATAQDGVGSQEPSRFIQQLELELAVVNPQFVINKRFYTLGNEERIAEHTVEKTPDVIARLDALLVEGLTFSKLNSFLECPLNFYYRYVLRIGEESKVEESIESNTLGTILHEVLENLLLPFARTNPVYLENNVTPNPVGMDDWKKMKDIAPLEVDKAFQVHFSQDTNVYASGTNHITYVVANEIIQKVLSREIAACENDPQSTLYIEALEHEIIVPTSFEIDGEQRPANLQGILDRIDKRNGNYRVIDYKSGGVKPEAVAISLGKSADYVEAILKKVRSKGEKNHVLQLLIYCYLFRHAYGKPLDEVGIFSFINTSESPFHLDFKGDLSLNEATDLVEQVIQAILQDVYDTETPFKHRHGAQYCSYCGVG